MIIAMPSVEMVLVFMAAALALNLTPGPDMLYVTARSVSDGRAAGVLSAFGIAAGTLVHIAALALGLAALLTAVPLAYDAVRIAGAIYLGVIGIQLMARPRTAAAAATLRRPAPFSSRSARGLLWQGTNEIHGQLPLRRHQVRSRGRFPGRARVQLLDVLAQGLAPRLRAARKAEAAHPGSADGHVSLQQAHHP